MKIRRINMKIKTVIERRVPNRAPENKLLYAVLMTMDTFFNVLLPFTLGLLFATTKSLLYILVLLAFLFVRLNFDIKGKKIVLKIVRGL